MPYKPTGRPPGRPRHPEPLTPAEQRVLRHLRDGHSNAEIAERLEISADAVKYHVSNMLGKLELGNREQLAAWREPSRVGRIWAGFSIAGWKVVFGGGAALAAIAAGIGVWAFTHDTDDDADIISVDSLISGVLTKGIDGQPANGSSMNPSISDDGRWVAFESEATNLVKDDTNGVSDIFVVDRVDGSIRRVSMAPGGKQANGASHRPAISGDGEWVAFDSEADNLVKDDRNGEPDRVMALVPDETATLLGRGRPDMTAASVGGSDVFVVNLESGRTELVSVTSRGEPGNLGSFGPSISGDGRFVAFESAAPNLVGAPARQGPGPGISPLLASDVFFRDRSEKTTARISKLRNDDWGATASGAAVISKDASAIAFVSASTDLAADAGYQVRSAYLWHRSSDVLELVRLPPAPAGTDGILFVGEISRPAVTSDGSTVAFSMSASAAKRPEPEGVEVTGVYIYSPGDLLPLLVPGSETSGQFGLAVSFTGDARTLVYQDLVNQQFSVGVYDLGSGLTKGNQNPAGTAPFLPVVSGNGRWIVALQDDSQRRGPTGARLFQIIVFPR